MQSSSYIHLLGTVGPNGSNNYIDVLLVQGCLSLVKDYTGKAYYQGSFDGRAGPEILDALKRFLTNYKFVNQATIKSDSPAIRVLSDLVRRNTGMVNAGARPHLTFDGRQLCWVGQPFNGKCWAGVSGAIGYQDKKFQSLRDKGPLPEGRWRVRQDRHQRLAEIPFNKKLLAVIGRGTWPGGAISWGQDRVWLEPIAAVSLYGRDNFSIHGGMFRGSAGCIDLTYAMTSFILSFERFGADMDLVVKY